MKIIAGTSVPELAAEIAKELNLNLIDVEIGNFANSEKRIWIKESIKGQNIIVVQSFSNPPDEHIIETLLLVDALERAGARHVNLVIPWMGYSIQDKVFREGEPIAAKVIASLVSHAYVKRVFLLDLHNNSIPGFFSIPTQHLSAIDLFVEYVKKNFTLSECLVTSPDFGGLKRARQFSEKLGIQLTNIDKHRNLTTGEVEAKELVGDVAGKNILVFDDFINTGSTVISVSELLKKNGAKSVHFFATHGLFAKDGRERVEQSAVDSVVVTNTVPQTGTFSKIKVVDAAALFAEALSAWVS